MDKVVRDGKVAILYSPGYGSGWFSDNMYLELLFSPKIVELVENDKRNEITTKWIEKELNLPNIYCGGAKNLTICWLEEGTKFYINEYDGSESVVLINEIMYIVA